MKNIVSLLFVCLILCSVTLTNAQEEKPIEIRPYIGKKLDRVERDYFHLFPKIEGFQEAEFYLNPDSTLRVDIVYEKNGDIRDTILSQYRNLWQLQNHIEQTIQFYLNDVERQDRGEFTVCTLKDSSTISGELLGVNNKSILIFNMDQNAYDKFQKDLSEIKVINDNEINIITLDDGKWNAAYIIYPVAGMILGGLVGASLEEDTKWKGSISSTTNKIKIAPSPEFWATVAGALIGSLVGVLLASALPIEVGSDGQYYTPFTTDDIEGIRDASRYEDEVPYYLKIIK